MKQARLPLGTLVVGIFLVGLSVAWPWVFSSRAAWTEEDAREHTAAASDLHRRSTEVEGGSDDGLTDARRRLDESQTRLDAARNRGQTVAFLLRWLGISIGLASAIVLFVRRE